MVLLYSLLNTHWASSVYLRQWKAKFITFYCWLKKLFIDFCSMTSQWGDARSTYAKSTLFSVDDTAPHSSNVKYESPICHWFCLAVGSLSNQIQTPRQGYKHHNLWNLWIWENSYSILRGTYVSSISGAFSFIAIYEFHMAFYCTVYVDNAYYAPVSQMNIHYEGFSFFFQITELMFPSSGRFVIKSWRYFSLPFRFVTTSLSLIMTDLFS